MRYLIYILFFFWLSPSAFAKKRLAVLDFNHEAIHRDLADILADQVREAALEATSRKKITILTQENMLLQLQKQGKDVSSIQGDNEVDIGRSIGARYVVSGKIKRIKGIWYATLKLHNTKTGDLKASKTIESDSEQELIAAVRVQSVDLLKSLKRKKKKKGKKKRIKEGFGSQVGSVDWNPSGAPMTTVTFQSEPPGATVLMNNDVVCETPCSKSVPAGAHQVRFSKRRYVGVSKHFIAKNGAKLSATLRPKFGWFSVESEPDNILIALDGELMGRTPIRKREIDPGFHEIKVVDRCVETLSYRFQSMANAYKTNIPTLRPQAKLSAIQVFARMGGQDILASVFVDGTRVGQTGDVIRTPLCAKELKLKTTDGLRWTQKLNLKEKQTQTINANFDVQTPERATAQPRSKTIEEKNRSADLLGDYKKKKRVKKLYLGEQNILDKEPSIVGGLNLQDVKKVIAKQKRQMRYCYERQLSKNSNLEGEITVKMFIASNGAVKKAFIHSSTLQSRAVHSCLIARFKRMRFPPPNNRGKAVVECPLTFKTMK